MIFTVNDSRCSLSLLPKQTQPPQVVQRSAEQTKISEVPLWSGHPSQD